MKHRLLISVMLLVLGACNLPKDSHASWETASRSGLKVGIVENPPFCYTDGGKLVGTEIRLLREFAQKENIKFSFETGSETNLIKRLENYEIQILAGGFKQNTVWKRKAGLTATYLDKRVMLIPRGENDLLRHLETFLLTKRHGIP